MTTTPRRVDGVDLSHHNADPDLVRAKQAGVRWVYHKATEGTSFLDPDYGERRKAAKLAGLPFGAYHFARPERPSDAKAEALAFLAYARPEPGDLLPCLDLEVSGELRSQSELRQWALDFSSIVRRFTGVLPVLYCPWNLDLPNLRWVPRYNDRNEPPTIPWDVWQFSNGNLGIPDSVAGVGHADLNTMRDGLKLGDLRIPVPAPPVPQEREGFAVRVVTQNVQALPLMPQGDVVEDVRLTASQAGLVFWQEMRPQRYEDAIRALDGWAETDNVGGCPISWRDWRFEALEQGFVKLHDGVPKMTENRYIGWVLLRNRSTRFTFLAHTWHYVAGAWNPRKDRQELRQKLWAQDNQRHKDFVLDWVERGVPIVGGGDSNSKLSRQLLLGERIGGRRVRYPVAPSSIDHLLFINGKGQRWDIDDADGELLLGRNSDHQGRRSTVRLEAR